MAVWLFALCGQLVELFYQETIRTLGAEAAVSEIHATAKRRRLEKMWITLSQLRDLAEANRRLHRDFRSMLMANCCLSVVTVIASAYYFIEYFTSEYWIVTVWDGSDVLEFCLRLWLICHTADCIRSSVRLS